MKSTLKRIKITSLIYNVLCIIFGVVLMINPAIAISTLLYILSAGLIICGIVEIVNYFIYGYESLGFWVGCIDLIMGIILISSVQILSNIGVFAFVFGIMFIFNSLNKLQKSFNYRRFGAKTWWIDTIFAIILLILGIVIVANPFVNARWFVIFLGISIIVNAIMEIISTLVVANRLKKMRHKASDLLKRKEADIEIDIDDYTIEK